MTKPLSIYRPLYVEPDGSVRRMTRGDCLAGTDRSGSFEDRMCGRVQCRIYACRQNLLVVHSADVPGRRHDGLSPEWTFTGKIDASSPSCALDVVDANKAGLSATEVARYTGENKRTVELITKKWRGGQGAAEVLRLAGDEE
jgi:hypothetical protein